MENSQRLLDGDNKGIFPSFFSYSKSEADFYATSNRISKCHSTYDRQSRTGMVCVVCGDTSSGKHYGVFACNGCSGFFKRSVRRKLEYRCQASGGECLVDKTHRNQCQACRLRKCLECGMNKDAVQNERQPRNTAMVRSESAFASPVSYSDNHIIRSPTNDITVGLLPTFLTFRHNMMTPVFPKINLSKVPTMSPINEEKSPESSSSGMFFQDLNSEMSKAESQITCNARQEIPLEYSLNTFYDMSTRILFYSVRWVKSHPTFSSLSLEDQTILFEGTWSDLFLLSIIQWSLPLESNSLFSSGYNAELPSVLNTPEYRKILHDLNKIFLRFKALRTDFTEFSCMRAIILFRSDLNQLKDTHQVQLLQDHAQLMLAHHIKSEHFDYTFRFGRHLILLPDLRQIQPHTVENLFFSQILNSMPVNELLRNILKTL